MAKGPYLTRERFCNLVFLIDKLLTAHETDTDPRYKQLIKKCEAALPQLKEYMKEERLYEEAGYSEIVACVEQLPERILGICSQLYLEDLEKNRAMINTARPPVQTYGRRTDILMQEEEDLEEGPRGGKQPYQGRSRIL
jgi:hypothetical protein